MHKIVLTAKLILLLLILL